MYYQESDNRFSRSNQFLYCHENENFRFLHQEYRRYCIVLNFRKSLKLKSILAVNCQPLPFLFILLTRKNNQTVKN